MLYALSDVKRWQAAADCADDILLVEDLGCKSEVGPEGEVMTKRRFVEEVVFSGSECRAVDPLIVGEVVGQCLDLELGW